MCRLLFFLRLSLLFLCSKAGRRCLSSRGSKTLKASLCRKKKSDVLSGCALPVASEEFVIEAGSHHADEGGSEENANAESEDAEN